jgi:hypothetical protein
MPATKAGPPNTCRCPGAGCFTGPRAPDDRRCPPDFCTDQLLADPDHRAQYLQDRPALLPQQGARALSDHATAENAAQCVQIEILGFAAQTPSWAPEKLAFIRDVVRGIEDLVPIPHTSGRNFLELQRRQCRPLQPHVGARPDTSTCPASPTGTPVRSTLPPSCPEADRSAALRDVRPGEHAWPPAKGGDVARTPAGPARLSWGASRHLAGSRPAPRSCRPPRPRPGRQ